MNLLNSKNLVTLFASLAYLDAVPLGTAFMLPCAVPVSPISFGARQQHHQQATRGVFIVSLAMVDGAFLNQMTSLEPALIATAAGLAGTAVGWTTRSGELSSLQNQNKKTIEELATTKNSLKTTKQEFEVKVEGYEKAIFEMDQEFEGQTTQIKAEFNEKLEKSRLELDDQYKAKFSKAKLTMEKETELKLLEQEGKLKQEFLQDKLSYESGFNNKSADDIVKALGRQSALITENQLLKESLDSVQADLQEIIKMKNKLF